MTTTAKEITESSLSELRKALNYPNAPEHYIRTLYDLMIACLGVEVKQPDGSWSDMVFLYDLLTEDAKALLRQGSYRFVLYGHLSELKSLQPDKFSQAERGGSFLIKPEGP